jgi:hypothetical protein
MKLFYYFIFYLVFNQIGFASEEQLGKVETDKRRDSHCSQSRRNVKALMQELDGDLKKETKGTNEM